MYKDPNKTEGYVYILEVKDIDLPVCKIGMTLRTPNERCEDINKSSTGDFIWEVAYQIAVDDCKRLELLVHKKLEPLRQKKREFFNLNVHDAYKALRSILDSISDINEIIIAEIDDTPTNNIKKTKKVHNTQFIKKDSKYVEILQSFISILDIKGRPFGQLNKPVFGMSDGNEGLQWNIAINTETEKVFLGVNLEGMKYSNWPIATFILNEFRNPTICKLKTKLEYPDSVFIRIRRDAWQVQSRPEIVEELLNGSELPTSEIDSSTWHTILSEALGCLSKIKGYRGRSKQTVTLKKQPDKGSISRILEVSPHLLIWTPINMAGDISVELKAGVKTLKPAYDWVSNLI